VNEIKDRIEDAVNATKAAVEEGIVPGGGVRYTHIRTYTPTHAPTEAVHTPTHSLENCHSLTSSSLTHTHFQRRQTTNMHAHLDPHKHTDAHPRAHTHPHAQAHTHSHAHTYTHTHTLSLSLSQRGSLECFKVPLIAQFGEFRPKTWLGYPPESLALTS